MILKPFTHDPRGCASYLLGDVAQAKALVVDPLLEIGVEPYVLEAAAKGLQITAIVETHMHADHLSAARALQEVTGATLYVYEGASLAIPFTPVRDGDAIEVGAVRLRVLFTPGHTLDSVCLVGEDATRARAPWFALTGDTLFSGDVGRPDLVLGEVDPGQVRAQAAMLYDSIFGRLLTLDDATEIYPGHFGGSPCGGVHLSGKPFSTVGFERRFNLALQQRSREAFIEFVTGTLRPQPERYRNIKEQNLKGVAMPGAEPNGEGPRLAPAEAQAAIAAGAVPLDVRPTVLFGRGHVPGALNVPFTLANLARAVEVVLPAGEPVVVIADNDVVARASVRALAGAYRVKGYLARGMAAWTAAGLPAGQFEMMSVDDLRRRLQRHEPLQVVDVRDPYEWEAGHIQEAALVPMRDLREHLPGLKGADGPLVVLCASGTRASTAASFFRREGAGRVYCLQGGMEEWTREGYPTAR
ncbi:MAG: MBL fold metallo-hydrolase [Armatimonadetes bacterium]|nr:MBL fold metallo-hydrolase [Armatimonadota bacterium]